MQATLAGQDVSVFHDFDKAEAAGLLSRSSWRQQGRKVPKDAVPPAIVVKKMSRLHKTDKQLVVPILEDKGELLIIADDWVDVFTEDQTTKQNKPELPESTVTSALLKQEQEGGGGGPSLMTPEESEVQSLQDITDTRLKTDICKVNSVRAYVPEGLLLPDNCPVKEQIWWFLGVLYWKHLERRETWETPINLMYDFLKANIPQWPTVWKWCDGLGLVERTPGYTPGERSYGYWTRLPYREQTHRLRTFEHAGLAKRLRAIQRRHLSRPIMIHLKKQLDRLSVDMNEFNARFITHPNRRYYLAHLQTILDGELRLTADGFSGRFHSNVSNMFKPLRALLRVDGEPDTLGETDIKNSQPLFLALAAMEQGVEDRKYLQLCEEGLIYEHMAGRLGVLRESAKHEIVKFFYAKNRFNSTAKSLFQMEFPKIGTFIRSIKTKDYKKLSRQMQVAERKFVIDTVCERLKRLKPDMFMTTIHDAVVAKKPDCDLIVTVMKEAFAEKGVHPRLEWQDVARHEMDEDWPVAVTPDHEN
ncbi:MAG: hypothetical protein WCJ09_16120 [Planctomycetota bacterium]